MHNSLNETPARVSICFQVVRGQCDQIGQLFAIWATFKSDWPFSKIGLILEYVVLLS